MPSHLPAVAVAVWLSSQIELVHYIINNINNNFSAFFFGGITAGLTATLFLKCKRIDTTDRLFLAGAISSASISLARAALIYAGPWALFFLSFTLTIMGALIVLTIPFSHVAFTISCGVIFAIQLFLNQHQVAATTSGVIMGLITMSTAVFRRGWDSPKQACLLSIVIALVVTALLESQRGSVRDTAKNRFSLISVPDTRRGTTHLLLINGRSHFVSTKEQRYHACLTQLPIHWATRHGKQLQRALVMFGGDGLIVRNLLAVKSIRQITVVEPDLGLVQLAKTNPMLRAYNLDSLSNPRTAIVHDNPLRWLDQNRESFDLVIADLPLPIATHEGKYYTTEFTNKLTSKIYSNGIVAVAMPSQMHLSLADDSLKTFAFEERSGERQFIIRTQIPSPLSSTLNYLTQQCITKSLRKIENQMELSNVMIGLGGEGRASMLHAQTVTRLSLPR